MLPVLSSKSLDSYIDSVYMVDMLSQEEELVLFKNYKENNDLVSYERIIHTHLKQVVGAAREMCYDMTRFADVIQEGNVGLIEAVEKFDPSKGARFSTLANMYIKGPMLEFIMRNKQTIRVAKTKPEKKLFFNLKKYQNHNFDAFTDDEIKTISNDLNVPEHDVKIMERRMFSEFIPYDGGRDSAMGSDDFGESFHGTISGLLFDPENNPETINEEAEHINYVRSRISDSINKLNPRDIDIINNRFVTEKEETLVSLGERYGVSAERIRQLYVRSLGVMRKDLQDII